MTNLTPGAESKTARTKERMASEAAEDTDTAAAVAVAAVVASRRRSSAAASAVASDADGTALVVVRCSLAQ